MDIAQKQVIVIMLVLAVAVGIVWWAVVDHSKWEDWCHSKGGTVSSHTDWTTVYTGNGSSRHDTDTTYYCITDDGKLLGVR